MEIKKRKTKLIIGSVAIIAAILWGSNRDADILLVEDPRVSREYFEEESAKASILFVGDIMLGRHVELAMDEHGPGYPFENMVSFFKEHNAVIGNLEGPINDLETHRRTPAGGFQFSFKPVSASALKEAGFTHLSLGNNHCTDYGPEGYLSTKKYLSEVGITDFGHSSRISKETTIATTSINGSEITLISLNASFSHPFDREAALMLVRTHESNIPTIVAIHWGDEYKLTSNSFQKDLAHELVDAGADLIIGHHPHVTQEVEKYNDVYIFYSLGNFIFDQYFSKDVQEGLAIQATLIKNDFAKFELFPVFGNRSHTTLMEEPRRSEFLKELAARSSPELTQEITGNSI